MKLAEDILLHDTEIGVRYLRTIILYWQTLVVLNYLFQEIDKIVYLRVFK